mgnify:CR=1 FL=1
MGKDRLLRLLLYANVLIVAVLVGYKLYLNFLEEDLEVAHAEQVEQIRSRIAGEPSYSFAVVGNINNSVGVFERKIVPMLNEADVDFVVSAGNAVSSGGEGKYRALYGALRRLEVPYLLTFGEHEAENLGSFRFYDHFGPHFFSFRAGGSHFLFLDGTGHSSSAWQRLWLAEALASSPAERAFAFIGRPLLRVEQETLFDWADHYLPQGPFRERLLALFRRHGVDAVFSANLPVYSRQERGGTAYVTTGGAGGLVLNNETSYYHYVRVRVSPAGVAIEPVPLDIGQHPVLKTVESLWLFVHSLVYVGYPNFILLVSALCIVAIWLYALVFKERDYYPDFDVDPTPYRGRPLRVAMFTNNYLPFIGGVPLSIDRLRRGLRGLGHTVRIFAPRYGAGTEHEEQVVRAPSLLAFGEQREFRVANLLAGRLWRELRRFRPDVVHVHHPFWLGSLGLLLGRRWRVPVVYTYHTRLEHYAHYVALPGPLFRNLISHALVKRFANKCDAVIVPTQSAEEYLRLVGVRSDIFVQPTGIDYQRFQGVDAAAVARLRQRLGIGEGERVLVSVSRLTKEKNLDFMLEGVAALHQQAQAPFRVLIVGEGQDRARLQGRIEEMGLAGTVQLPGAVAPEEIPVYYALGDAFLFASKSETQGMVILEAMAAGLPVVAVRSSGIDDVVRDGVTGFKTPENRRAWAQRAARLLADEPMREEMARAALAFAQQYDIEPVARDVADIYAYVMAAREQLARA